MSADLPGYDEPLDDPLLDPDPVFRDVDFALNAAGFHTVSSCQGHPPGTQYDHVQVWMDPYITCAVDDAPVPDARRTLKAIGARRVEVSEGAKVAGSFPRGWDWARSLARLRTTSCQRS